MKTSAPSDCACQLVADKLSVRWYAGYNLDEPLPDHFSRPKRTRWTYLYLSSPAAVGAFPHQAAHPRLGRHSFQTRQLARQPFAAVDTPLLLTVKGQRIPSWGIAKNSADTPPLSPVASEEPVEDVTLVPYGSESIV